jgi:hypothetical protein
VSSLGWLELMTRLLVATTWPWRQGLDRGFTALRYLNDFTKVLEEVSDIRVSRCCAPVEGSLRRSTTHQISRRREANWDRVGLLFKVGQVRGGGALLIQCYQHHLLHNKDTEA